ncbi:glycosyltransferase family 39 protein [Actinoplanes sp. NPDC024001]|uniref:glycosyltransferase family 39 protein n=1 Tax=Actinoplanes sp. NPDC024001 TaxID=3154598 RepID=UPI0033D36BF8
MRPPVATPPPPAPAGHHQLVRLLPALVSGTLMLAFGLIQAGRPGLSWDEVTSAEVSQRTVPQIWEMAQNIDAVFAPYYVFLHYWSAVVGTSEVQLRLPSILAMAGGVAVAAELGRRLFNPMIGLVTGLILAVLPNTSRYAAEVRPYAFACFFSVLALLLLVGAVRRPGPYRWAGYGLSLLGIGLFHLVALTTLVAHAVLVGLFVWRTRRRRTAAAWAGTVLAAMLPLLPIAYLGLHQEDTQLHWVRPITQAAVRAMPGEVVGSPEAAWLLIGLVVLASWRPLRRIAPMAALAAGPLVALALVSALVSPMWVARYLLVVLAPLAMLAAIALAGGRDGWARYGVLRIVAVLLLLAAVTVPAHRAVRSPTAKNGPDYRTVARIVGDRQQSGDVVVYPPGNRAMRAGLDYYLNRLPARPGDPLVRVPSAEAAKLTADEYPDDVAHLAGADRIWVVAGSERDDPAAARPALRRYLAAGYRRAGFWQPERATVALYERTRAS